jgi:hypothetical protein
VACAAVGLLSVVITTGSPLGNHVGVVVSICAKEETLHDVAAGRVIAVVENFHTDGDRSIDEFPCKAMGHRVSAIDVDPAVSLGVGGASPFHAAR